MQSPTDQLYDAVRRRECVLFLGAGVHYPPPEKSAFTYPPPHRPPLGKALSEQLAAECTRQVEHERAVNRLDLSSYGVEQRELQEAKWKIEEHQRTRRSNYISYHKENLQRISWYYETFAGRESLIKAVNNAVASTTQPSPLLNALAELDFPIVITTNYDCLYENALSALKKRPETRIYNPTSGVTTRDFRGRPKINERWLYKIHGCVTDPRSMVITDEDYINFVMRMSDSESFHPVPQAIRANFRDWTTLFVGYSLLDYNLRLLFQTLWRHVDPVDRPATFSLDPSPDMLVMKRYSAAPSPLVWFIEQDSWAFIPRLYEEIMKRPMIS